jgi:hypothetical protein
VHKDGEEWEHKVIIRSVRGCCSILLRRDTELFFRSKVGIQNVLKESEKKL